MGNTEGDKKGERERALGKNYIISNGKTEQTEQGSLRLRIIGYNGKEIDGTGKERTGKEKKHRKWKRK